MNLPDLLFFLRPNIEHLTRPARRTPLLGHEQITPPSYQVRQLLETVKPRIEIRLDFLALCRFQWKLTSQQT
jgi:hypothetical protein